jgi:adenylosuccinate synthase
LQNALVWRLHDDAGPEGEVHMPLHVIIGAQWGDEGKGRILDAIAGEAAIVARFSGGDNAGHTVTADGKIFRLHLIPSGIVHPGPLCILGSGMVINPQRLQAEMDQLRSQGVECSPERIKISHAAHLLTPLHIALDLAEEAAREKKIGTTGRGIGPAFSEKTARCGLRAEVLAQPEECADKIKTHILRGNRTLEIPSRRWTRMPSPPLSFNSRKPSDRTSRTPPHWCRTPCGTGRRYWRKAPRARC